MRGDRYKKTIGKIALAAREGRLLRTAAWYVWIYWGDRDTTQRLLRRFLTWRYRKLIARSTRGDVPTGTRPKRIFILWLQGLEKAPELVRACAASVSEQLPGYQIIVLTEENIREYTDLPDYIWKKYKKGRIRPAHFSDLVRLNVLDRLGGMWIDATVLCTGAGLMERIEDCPLFVFRIFPDASRFEPIVASNWFISACSHHPILELTERLLLEYWKGHPFILHYYLFHLFFSIAAEHCAEEWSKVPFVSNGPPHSLQQLLLREYDQDQMEELVRETDFHKLTYKFPRQVNVEEESGLFYHHICGMDVS